MSPRADPAHTDPLGAHRIVGRLPDTLAARHLVLGLYEPGLLVLHGSQTAGEEL